MSFPVVINIGNIFALSFSYFEEAQYGGVKLLALCYTVAIYKAGCDAQLHTAFQRVGVLLYVNIFSNHSSIFEVRFTVSMTYITSVWVASHSQPLHNRLIVTV